MTSFVQMYKSPRVWITVILTLIVFDRWTVYNTPLSGLDGSWIIAIHLTHQLGLIHGTEFVFTYGPLSWLITRLPIAAPGWALVLFDLLWLGNVASLLYLAIGARLDLKPILFVTFLAIIHHQCAGQEVSFSFYFFVVFWLVYHKRTNHSWALAIAVGLSVMTLYLKANVGLVCIGSVVLYGLWPGGKYPARLIAVGCLFVLVGVSVHYLPVKLYPFVVADLHLIDSYNDVMYSFEDRRSLVVIFSMLGLSAALFGFVVWRLRLWRTTNLAVFWRNDGLLLLLVALQVFVLYKESAVRADTGHTSLFFKFGTWSFGLLVLFAQTTLVRRMAVIPVFLISVATPYFATYNWDPAILYRWIPRSVAYCQDVIKPQRPVLAPAVSPWPDRWITQLRGKRVDVVPVDVSLLFASRLRYAPRPVIQTYQVTDGYLDSLNAAYFLSNQAPDYVLLTASATDKRDAFADETQTKLALLRTYQVADTTNAWLLLQRRPAPLLLSLQKKETIEKQLNEQIDVQSDSATIQLWQIRGHYGIGGSLSRLLFQPPRLKLELTYLNGETKQFRTALPLLEDGLLLPGQPQTVQELSQYWQSAGQLPLSAQVKSCRILTDGQWPLAYKPSISITRQYYHVGSKSAGPRQITVLPSPNKL